MEKIVYILGAGFSVPLGLPVTANFLEMSKDLYQNNRTQYQHFQKVFNFLQRIAYIHNYFFSDQSNVEEILSILEMMHATSANNSEIEEFKKYICDTIKYYTPQMYTYDQSAIESEMHTDGYGWPWHIFGGRDSTPNFSSYIYFVASLLKLTIQREPIDASNRHYDLSIRFNNNTTKNKYSVVTLNYDNVLEMCLHDISNFSGGVLFTESQSYNPEFTNEITYCKLHGSITNGEVTLPTWNKTLSKEVIINTWGNAFQVLKDATQIRIIGYSLPVTDTYIHFLLKSALVESENLKNIDVICLDGTNEVKKRYDEFILFKKYRFKNASTQDYLLSNKNAIIAGMRTYKTGGTSDLLTMPCDKIESVHKNFMSYKLS
jgi:hypothetical protein